MELQFILNQRRCQKHLTWDKEKRVGLWFNGPKSSLQMIFYFLVLCQGPQTYPRHTVWRKCRGTESKVFEVQCVVSAVCGGLGCHFICWCCLWFYQQKDFRGLHAFFCCQTSWRCQYNFPAGLSTSLYCQMVLLNGGLTM